MTSRIAFLLPGIMRLSAGKCLSVHLLPCSILEGTFTYSGCLFLSKPFQASLRLLIVVLLLIVSLLEAHLA